MLKLMAANWKMYKTSAEAAHTVRGLCESLQNISNDRQVLIFAPFTALEAAAKAVAQGAPVALGAQNFYPAKEGAYTGEISLDMVQETGATWVLIGHSERRHIFGESLEFLQQKLAFALEHGIRIVFCVGETLEEREAGHLEAVLTAQLACLAKLPASLKEAISGENFAVAYEPVWAIGTGKVAGHEEVVQAHAQVRNILQNLLHEKGAKIRILYGGSVKADNASGILGLDNVDGVLVGGASLQVESFARIVTA